MSDEQRGDAFDIQRVRDLVQMMIEHDLTEVDLRQHGQTIRLRRGGDPVPVQAAAPMPVQSPTAAQTPGEGAAANEDADVVIVKSPMVGTYYSRPNPEAEPFVKVGQEISSETTVCIIEAMKVFNEIPAEVAGKVVAVLVDNEEPVEFGTPLIKVRPLR